MRLNVPRRQHRAFWYYAPFGDWWWYARSPLPPCAAGEELVWTMNRQAVASAICSKVLRAEKPGWWRIYWTAASFEDLRDEDRETFVPQLYGGYAEQPEMGRR